MKRIKAFMLVDKQGNPDDNDNIICFWEKYQAQDFLDSEKRQKVVPCEITIKEVKK